MSALIHEEEYNQFINKFRKFKPIDFLNESDIVLDQECVEIDLTAKKNIEELKELINNLKILDENLIKEKSKIKKLLKEIEPDLIKLKEFKNVSYLLERLEKIKNIHLNLEKLNKKNIKNENESSILVSIDYYNQILDEVLFLFKIQSSKEFCEILKRIILYWNEFLIKKIEPIFDNCLKSLNWPVTSISGDQIDITEKNDALKKFKKYFEGFLKLDESLINLEKCFDVEDNQNENSSINESFNDCDQFISEKTINEPLNISISAPVNKLINPLKKRFIYHFEQETKVNRLDKPEWYLTQIINWIKNHENFLENITDPIFMNISKNNLFSTKIQFIYVLTNLAKRKMESDLIQVVYNDQLFSHLFDEAVIFTNELKNFLDKESYLINTNFNLIELFLIEPYFSKLIHLERKKTTQYVENILSSDNAWNSIINTNNFNESVIDNYKIPECVDKFVLLLQSITERYLSIENLESKSAFVNLQLESLDDFRLRLAQLINNPLNEEKNRWPFYSNYFSILNSLNYLIIILEDWKFQPIFMEVSEYLCIDSVFDDILSLLNHLLNEMQDKIINGFFNQIRLKLSSFTKIKWFCLKEDDQELIYSTYELFFQISSSVDYLKKMLAENLFDKLIRIITNDLNNLFIEEFILKCTFNDYGSQILYSSFEKNLLPIFQNFFNDPELKFKELFECCKILNLTKENNFSLLNHLDNLNVDLEYENLTQFDIDLFKPKLLKDILKRRIFLHD